MNRGKALLYSLIALAGVAVLLFELRFSEPERLRKEPESDLFTQAQMAASAGDCLKAIRIYQVLLEKDPRHAMAMEFLSDCQQRTQDLKAAAASLEQALRLEPGNSARRYKLASIYDRLGEKRRADGLRAEAKGTDSGAKTPSPPKEPASRD